MMSQERNLTSMPDAQWPHCTSVGGLCPVFEMSQVLGSNLQEMLMKFVLAGELGARLTIQKNRDGFTAQITSAVHRSDETPIDLVRLHALRQVVSSVSLWKG